MNKKNKSKDIVTSVHDKNMIQGIPKGNDGTGIPGRES